MEEKLIKDLGIEFFPIKCGKLRRYFSWENYLDFFKFIIGIFQSYFLIRKIKPDLLFSKGGYVSLPVVIGAYLRSVPVYIHESDLSPGLANKISSKFADKIFLSFPESKDYFSKFKGEIIVTGTPIREELFQGNKEKALKFLKFESKKPILFIIGGSLGASQINNLVKNSFKELCEKFNIVHQSGSGKSLALKDPSYREFPFIKEEFSDILAVSDLVVSRAGSNSLFEMALLRKKAVIIPMEAGRGDQVENAEIFSKELSWPVLKGEISVQDFLKSISIAMSEKIKASDKFKNGAETISLNILKNENSNKWKSLN